MLKRFCIGAVACVALSGCMTEPQRQMTMDATEAGAFFGEMCLSHYPDVDAALAFAQSRFRFAIEYESGLREVITRDFGILVNEDICAVQFLTDGSDRLFLDRFAQASEAMATNRGSAQVTIDRTDRPDGLTQMTVLVRS